MLLSFQLLKIIRLYHPWNLILGCVFIVAVSFGENFRGGGIVTPSNTGKTLPNWLGRTFGILISLIFVYSAFRP